MKTFAVRFGSGVLAAVFAAVLLAATAACASMSGRGDPVPSEAILVEYSRTGGFANFDDHLVLREDGRASVRRRGGDGEVNLDAKHLQRVRSVLDGAGLESLREAYKVDGADQFTYTITVRHWTITCNDGAVPPALEPVIRALNEVVDNAAVPPR